MRAGRLSNCSANSSNVIVTCDFGLVGAAVVELAVGAVVEGEVRVVDVDVVVVVFGAVACLFSSKGK